MFDIAWSEFLVVAVVALVVVGPKDLPALLRTVGKTIASLRRMAGEFQGQFNEAMREAELDGLKDELTGMKDKASRMVGGSPFQIARDEIKNALSDKPKTPSALAGDAETAKEAADAPSALAPAPSIDPTPEPPAPTPADFAIKAAPAMRPAEPAPAAEPQAAAKAAALKAASGAAPETKAAPRKRAPSKTAAPKAVAPAETIAPTKPRRTAADPAAEGSAPKPSRARKKTEQTPPGASA